MELLTFEVRGKMAHFRKYYANNTAFSFSIPPRTTLMGMVAAAMGWEKDSYYERLSTEHIRFGLRVLEPIKKSFHRVNFLRVETVGNLAKSMSSDLRGHGGRIQTPFEVITPVELTRGEVAYKVFLGPSNTGDDVFQQIKRQLLDHPPVYNISLGTANFQASIGNIRAIEEPHVKEHNTNDFVLMHSAVPSKLVKELAFEKENLDRYNLVEEELLPGEFIADYNRELKSMNRLLFSLSEKPLRVRLNGSYWMVSLDGKTLNVQFMDV